jgi:hypothetical protein
MSWAIEPPADFCASAKSSRIFHSLRACSPDVVIIASWTRPASIAAPSASASGALSVPGSPCPATSISTYHGCTVGIGSLWPGTPASRSSMIDRRSSSNAEIDSPSLERSSDSSSTAAAGLATPI